MIIRQKIITRNEVRRYRECIYVFGDNMLRRGLAGQAKEMRGEPNTIGIPTKRFPTNTYNAFFTNTDWDNALIRNAIMFAISDIKSALYDNTDVIIPADGIGTGLAQLDRYAPVIFDYIQGEIAMMEERFGVRHER